MSRINTNVPSLIAQRVLNQNNDALNTSLERLSTGLRINSGKDDPAGLIASQNLQAEQTGINTAISNAQRADNIVSTADGGLNEVSSLLTQLQGLVGQAANTGGLSSDEIQANQLQVDSILSTINRIAGSTSFQGTQLLNGNYAYATSTVGTSALNNLQINAAQLANGATQSVVVHVVSAAKTGEITYNSGTLSANKTLEISGNDGTTQIALQCGTTIAGIATAINGVKATTGVSAFVSGAVLRIDSVGYGASQFVGVKAVAGAFNASAARATGHDANVTVNGAQASTDGLTATYRGNNLDISFDLTATANVAGKTKTFGITGGGATFALGSQVNESNKASLGIQSVSTGNLGDTVLGYLSSLGSGQANSLSSTNLGSAQKILNKAITQVSQLRGRLGAFQKFTIGSTVNSLNVALENTSAAESDITDTDFAAETSNLTRSQILSSAASTVLAQANSAPQNALKLLQNA